MSALPPPSLAPLLGALTLAILVALIIRRFNIPYTVALVVAGLFLGLMSRYEDLFKIELGELLSAQTIFYLILPPLLFDGASKLSFESFKRNWRITTLLAVPAVVISMLVIGGIVWVLVWNSDPDMFLFALLLGAVLAPTDPVSVLALFKECGAPHQLSTIVESESLFNDGTGVVLFQVMLALVIASLSGEGSGLAETFLSGTMRFAWMVIVGAMVGAAIAYAANRAMIWTHNHLLEVTITVAVAFGAFIAAENFHGSGVIAVVIAGMMVGNEGKIRAMTPQARVALDNFWEMVAFLMNSVLFLLIGFEMMNRISISSGAIVMAAVAIIAALVARLIVYPMSEIVTRWSPDDDIPREWRHVIFWGGLRGSIPLALMLILLDVLIAHPEAGVTADAGFLAQTYDEMLLMAFSVVLFTLLVQGMTITPLMRKLGVSQGADGRSEEFEHAVATMMTSGAALLELERMKKIGLAPDEQISKAKQEEQNRIDAAKEILSKLCEDPAFAERLQGRLSARIMAIRQRALDEAEKEGLVSEHTAHDIRWKVDTELSLLLESDDLQGEVPLPQAIDS